MIDLDRFRQVRWVQGGREFPYLDCYGVVNEVRRALRLPLWPEYQGITKDAEGLERTASEYSARASSCEPSPGAVAFCYEGAAVTHVAVVVFVDGRLQALESNPKRHVSVVPIERLLRRFVRVEFYT